MVVQTRNLKREMLISFTPDWSCIPLVSIWSEIFSISYIFHVASIFSFRIALSMISFYLELVLNVDTYLIFSYHVSCNLFVQCIFIFFYFTHNTICFQEMHPHWDSFAYISGFTGSFSLSPIHFLPLKFSYWLPLTMGCWGGFVGGCCGLVNWSLPTFSFLLVA